jgi:hypothetical protein
MRFVVLVLLAGCAVVPGRIVHQAGDRLGVHGKGLLFLDHDRFGSADLYTFCRRERGHDVGSPIPVEARNYDGACVTLVCNGTNCE